jgi:hypothetical protein
MIAPIDTEPAIPPSQLCPQCGAELLHINDRNVCPTDWDHYPDQQASSFRAKNIIKPQSFGRTLLWPRPEWRKWDKQESKLMEVRQELTDDGRPRYLVTINAPTSVTVTSIPPAVVKAKYAEYVALVKPYRIKPKPFADWSAHYLATQARLQGR